MKDIWIPLSGAMAQQNNVETIANNIANANTPGFKKDQQVFKEYLTIFNKNPEVVDLPRKEWKPEDFYRTQGSEYGFVKSDGTFTVFDQGQLTPTNNPLDLGINGPGLIEVLSPNGIRFTRKGNFSISKDGLLVTDQGFPVLSAININEINDKGVESTDETTNGLSQLPQPQERFIKIGEGNISINLKGEIFQKDRKLSQISVTEFNDLNALVKEGNSLFANPNNRNIKSDQQNSSLHQGFLESSNVNAVTEMSALIKANRHFESIQKAIKAYDHMAEKSVNEISKF